MATEPVGHTEIRANTVAEKTNDTGVTVDSALIKDGTVNFADVSAPTTPSSGFTVYSDSGDSVLKTKDASGNVLEVRPPVSYKQVIENGTTRSTSASAGAVIAGMELTVTVPANSLVECEGFANISVPTDISRAVSLWITEDATTGSSGGIIGYMDDTSDLVGTTGDRAWLSTKRWFTPTAASHTYRLILGRAGSNTVYTYHHGLFLKIYEVVEAL